MAGQSESKPWRGFSAPLHPEGKYALYGPPPWHFEGYMSAVRLRCDPDAIDHMVPEPMKTAADPFVEIAVFDCRCDYGLGEGYVQRNPDQVHFQESFVRHFIEYAGAIGYWMPYIWCNTDSEFAIGREMYGWPHKWGNVALTERPFRGWRAGDIVTGLVGRGCRAVMEFESELEQPGDRGGIGVAQGAADDTSAGTRPGQTGTDVRWGSSFTQVALPHPTDEGMVLQRLVRNQMLDVDFTDIWTGKGSFEVYAPELQYLKGAEVVSARWHTIVWTKPYSAEVVLEELVAA